MGVAVTVTVEPFSNSPPPLTAPPAPAFTVTIQLIVIGTVSLMFSVPPDSNALSGPISPVPYRVSVG